MSNGQCTGKARYKSPQEAHRQLARRTKRQTYAKAHVYRCPDCAGYHIGHRKSW